MTNFSSFLNTDPKKYSPGNKAILFCLLMASIIFFFVLMAVQTFIKGSKNLQGLTHVTGHINNERYMKHKHVSKYRVYYENVFVFSIEGCSDEFGFMEFDKNYPDLTSMHIGDNQAIADIYYDKSGQRIEENVTLNIFDLKINDERYIKIEEIQKSEKTGSFIFSLLAIVLSWLTYKGAKRIKLKGVID